MSSQTPGNKVVRRLIASNIGGKPTDKMTLYTREVVNRPMTTVYGQEIPLRPSSSQPSLRKSPGERLAKTYRIQEITSDMIVETDPIIKKEKLKNYKPFFEYPRERIELRPQHRGTRTSLYQRDFVKPTPLPTLMLKNDFFTTKHTGRTMDFGTTARNDYKPWVAIPTKTDLSSTRTTTFRIPFAATSAYKSSYVNWGGLALNTDRHVKPETLVPGLKILTKTTYREDFKKVPDNEKKSNEFARGIPININKLPKEYNNSKMG